MPDNVILRGKMTIAPRFYRLPPGHVFLFGPPLRPRGTGKTTWLSQLLKDAPWVNLLRP